MDILTLKTNKSPKHWDYNVPNTFQACSVQLHPQLHIDGQTKKNANLQENGTASTELKAV
jgi:hypothetical protein